MVEEAPMLVGEPVFNISLDLIITGKSPFFQSFLEVEAVKRIFENLSAELLKHYLARHRHKRTNISMQNNPGGQFVTSSLLDILSQFMLWGTVRGSIGSRIVWGHPCCKCVMPFNTPTLTHTLTHTHMAGSDVISCISGSLCPL
ncbi:hypothetical protein TNCV_1681351 [Trichonephila clavipes]|nr:hypothetical protein TNCV_1681351 [Trichonephila clavipes]